MRKHPHRGFTLNIKVGCRRGPWSCTRVSRMRGLPSRTCKVLFTAQLSSLPYKKVSSYHLVPSYDVITGGGLNESPPNTYVPNANCVGPQSPPNTYEPNANCMGPQYSPQTLTYLMLTAWALSTPPNTYVPNANCMGPQYSPKKPNHIRVTSNFLRQSPKGI